MKINLFFVYINHPFQESNYTKKVKKGFYKIHVVHILSGGGKNFF